VIQREIPLGYGEIYRSDIPEIHYDYVKYKQDMPKVHAMPPWGRASDRHL